MMNPKHLVPTMSVAILLSLVPGATIAAESYDSCSGFIDSLPAVISTQGTWCMRKDLSTAVEAGTAITVATNNVTIDCNGFKLGGLAAGPDTQSIGVLAQERQNITVRNCNVRGFHTGIDLSGSTGSGGHLVESNRLDNNVHTGIYVQGDGLIRGNLVADTGGDPAYPGDPMFGILGQGTVDILDNVVSGVIVTPDSSGWVIGIAAYDNIGGTIRGNRVRGVVSDPTGAAIGINLFGSARVTLRENDVIGSGSGTGVHCSSASSRALDNVVGGFPVLMENCGDAGGNDLTVVP